nr:DUF2510 domain-containing protein [Lysinibacter cavernae]
MPPGWYTIPGAPGQLRYWDGRTWLPPHLAPYMGQQGVPQGAPHLASQGASHGAPQGTPANHPPQYPMPQSTDARGPVPQFAPHPAGQSYPAGPAYQYGQQGPGPGYQHGQQGPRRGNGRGCLIVSLVLLGVLMLGIVAACVGVQAVIGRLADETKDYADGIAVADGHYVFEERPSFPAMLEHVTEIQDLYTDAQLEGTMAQLAPNGVARGEAYVEEFIWTINTQYISVQFLRSKSSTDAQELDDLIAGIVERVDLLESEFLAGSDLSPLPGVTRPDGTSTDAGTSLEPETQTSMKDAEQFARDFVPQLGADGTYLAAADELYAEFGMVIDYDYAKGGDYCLRGDTTWVLASFCPVVPDRVFVNTAHGAYPAMYADLEYINILKHELAHRRIFDICGTTRPPIAGGSVEAVTSSYADLILGSDIDESTKPPEYARSTASDEAALALSEGRCS